MLYEEALNFIGSRLRFGIKPGLERTQALLERMGEPQRKLRFVHIAGTNGKGSTCAMIASALTAAGYRTGTFNSPYITDFREQMQIDGVMISRGELAELTERAAALLGDDDEITQFELVTCIALLWFSERGCDIVLLECGMGGRLDSTNVIASPLCAVITRIDLDHMAVLGDTVEKIAAEKAGIIKRGCSVVMADGQPDGASGVIEQCAARLGCMLYRPEAGRLIRTGKGTLDGTDVIYKGIGLHIPFAGAHQISNAMTAVEVLRVLGVDDEYIAKGIAAAHIPARLEKICAKPVILLDGAHNPNGAAALAEAMDTLLSGCRIIGVTGVLADKDYDTELPMLGSRMSTMYCCDGFSPRCLSAAELARSAAGYTDTVACDTPESAFSSALSEALDRGDTAVVVCGSLYLAARVRPYILSETEKIARR